MNALISTVNPVTMTSLELVDYINSQRCEGEAELRHSDFLAKVPNVLGGGERNFSSTYRDVQNKERPCKARQCCTWATNPRRSQACSRRKARCFSMAERGVIRNRQFAQQLRDFSGLRFGKITPTDIYGFMDFGDRLFVVLEGKHQGSQLHYGQRLALERLVDACHCPPRRVAVALILDHVETPEQDVDFGACLVRAMRWNGAWVPQHHKQITCRKAIERLLAYSENMQRAHLRVVQGGKA